MWLSHHSYLLCWIEDQSSLYSTRWCKPLQITSLRWISKPADVIGRHSRVCGSKFLIEIGFKTRIFTTNMQAFQLEPASGFAKQLVMMSFEPVYKIQKMTLSFLCEGVITIMMCSWGPTNDQNPYKWLLPSTTSDQGQKSCTLSL